MTSGPLNRLYNGNGLPKPLTGEQSFNAWMPSSCAAGMVCHLLWFDAFVINLTGCHQLVLGCDWFC